MCQRGFHYPTGSPLFPVASLPNQLRRSSCCVSFTLCSSPPPLCAHVKSKVSSALAIGRHATFILMFSFLFFFLDTHNSILRSLSCLDPIPNGKNNNKNREHPQFSIRLPIPCDDEHWESLVYRVRSVFPYPQFPTKWLVRLRFCSIHWWVVGCVYFSPENFLWAFNELGNGFRSRFIPIILGLESCYRSAQLPLSCQLEIVSQKPVDSCHTTAPTRAHLVSLSHTHTNTVSWL